MSRTRFDAVYADLRNYQLTARAIRQARPDRVIHLAALGVSDPFLNVNAALSHNVTGTINLLRACFERGEQAVKQVVVARTPGEHSAMNVYAASKAAAWAFCEMYARTACWPIHGAMIFQAYGRGQPSHHIVPAAIKAALAGEDLPMTTGEQKKDWIHVDDVVTGIVGLLGKDLDPGATADLGSGTALSVLAVVECIYDLVGRGGLPLAGMLPSRPGEVQEQQANLDHTQTLIDWRPVISLETGLASLISDAEGEQHTP
jgi:nucleoside-diphosphate-sugar epimerase